MPRRAAAPFAPADNPAGALERTDDVLPIGLFERPRWVLPREHVLPPVEGRHGHVENGAGATE